MNIETIKDTAAPPNLSAAERRQWIRTAALERLGAEVIIHSLEGTKIWLLTHTGITLSLPVLTEIVEAYRRFKKGGLKTNCHDISSLAAHTKVGDGVIRSDNLSGYFIEFSDHSLAYKQLNPNCLIAIDFLAEVQINDGDPKFSMLVVEGSSMGDLCWRLAELYQGHWRQLQDHDWQSFYHMEYPDHEAQRQLAIDHCQVAGLLGMAFYAGEE